MARAEGAPGTSVGIQDAESALARALDAAVTAGRFDVVQQLAKELEARRLARMRQDGPEVRKADVLDLKAERERRK